MRLADVLGIALSALCQRKVRTALTLSGVVIGTFILAINLSLGRGTQDEILRQLRRGQELRQVMVWPRYEAREQDIPAEDLQVKGDMSDAKRARLRQAIVRRWQAHGGQPRRNVLLTRERIQAIAALPHVESVVPPRQGCRAVLDGKGRDVLSLAATTDNDTFHQRLVAGDYFPSDAGHEAIVGEYLLYLWDIRSDDAVAGVLGRKLRLEYRTGSAAPATLLALLGAGRTDLSADEALAMQRAMRRLPAVLDKLDLMPEDVSTLRKLFTRLAPSPSPEPAPPVVAEFTITGVFRELTDEEFKDSAPLGWGVNAMSRNTDIWLPASTAQEMFLRVPQIAENGFPSVLVTVDSEEHVKEVTERVHEMELDNFAPLNVIEEVRSNLILTAVLTGLLAAAALLVAVLGITNTMLMSVLERTREIGIMKAVGARDWHVQALFLVEGTVLGVCGGAVGVLLAWLASFPGDALARTLLHQSTQLNLTGRLFVFPWWLTLGLPALAGVVTTLAAVYPARRAARVNPIAALRHE
jgi:putative ABC transport system permease protein